MKRVAVFYPHDSFPTFITFEFSLKAIELFRRKGFKVDRFPIFMATRPFFLLSHAFNSGYDLIVYAGHGWTDKLIGQNVLGLGLLYPMADTSLNPKSKIMYSVACLTGKKLGPDYIRKRVRSYIGSPDYVMIAYPKPEHNYMNDFIDTFLEFLRNLVNGRTVSESLWAMKERMKYYIDLYDRNKHRWVYAKFYKVAMIRNLNGFRVYGEDVKL